MPEETGRESVEHQRSQRVEPPAHSTGEMGNLPVTELVPQMPGSLMGSKSLGGRGNGSVRTAIVQQMQQTYGNRAVQRYLRLQRSSVSTPPSQDDDIARRIGSRSGGGASLDTGVQRTLEQGLGTDLSGVRVHTDGEADHLARSVDSVAFTTGSDIFFRQGAYNPSTPGGMHLLAHEVTHTVQQASGPVAGTPSAGGVSISDPSDQFEQAAEQSATNIMAGNPAPVQTSGRSSPSSLIQREVRPEEGEDEQAKPAQAMRGWATSVQRQSMPDEKEARSVQAMQGSAAVQRQPSHSQPLRPQAVAQRQVAVQRDPPTPTVIGAAPTSAPAPGPGSVPAPGTTAASPAIPADLQAFRARGPLPSDALGMTIAPSTGLGGFNARYDPTAMVLTVTVNVAMTFVDGMAITGNRVTAKDPSLQRAATALNRMLSRLRAGAKRTAALDKIRSDWQWTGPGDPRITTFMATYKSATQSAWSSAGTSLAFQSSKTGWESQLANVNVIVNATNVMAPAPGVAAAAGPSPTHTQGTIFKTPDGNNDMVAAVGHGSAASGTDQTLKLGSSQVAPTNNLLTTQVTFGSDSASLSSGAKSTLRKFIVSFRGVPGGAGTSIDITGRANTKGAGTPEGDRRNNEISLKRAQAVEHFLKTTKVKGQGLTNANTRIKSTTGVGSTGAEEGPEWRRVDVAVAGGAAQLVAAHEFGHMIGLDDEYAIDPGGMIGGTGGPTGTSTGHDALAKSEGLPGSVHENNDNIMSLGNTVRPQHYSTFMEALRTVTGLTEWGMKR